MGESASAVSRLFSVFAGDLWGGLARGPHDRSPIVCATLVPYQVNQPHAGSSSRRRNMSRSSANVEGPLGAF